MDRALMEALNPAHDRWRHRAFRAAHTIDIIVRKDGHAYRYEGDFLKDVSRVLVPAVASNDNL